MDASQLFDSLETVPVIDSDAVVYRHVSPGRDCRSGDGARAHGGRWNPRTSFPVLYTALTPHVARLELERLASRQGVEVADVLPRTLCVLKVQVERVLDLSGDEALALLGLTPSDLTGDDTRRCQQVGDVAHRMGFEGLLVPSATGVGTNLILFPLNLGSGSSVDENPPITWAVAGDLPTS